MDSALAEKAEPSEKVVLNLRKGSAKATLAVLAESSDVVQPDVTDNRGIDKTGAEMADGREPLPKEHSVDAELQKIEEPANIQEQDKSVENMQVQSLELKTTVICPGVCHHTRNQARTETTVPLKEKKRTRKKV